MSPENKNLEKILTPPPPESPEEFFQAPQESEDTAAIERKVDSGVAEMTQEEAKGVLQRFFRRKKDDESDGDAVLSPAQVAEQQIVRSAVQTIMADDLKDLYAKMNPKQQEKFREEGKVVATKISQLIVTAKLNLGAVIGLLRGWLRLLPGVNRLFVEQAAKIKADTVIRYAEQYKHNHHPDA